MKEQDRNITWHEGKITKEDREKLLNQKGAVIWFTGLSGSGKSTIAHRLEEKLCEMGHIAYSLDGDNIRHGLNKDLGFSPEDRTENIRRIGEVAHLFADAGIIALTSFISPYRKDRNAARDLVPQGRFVEVFCQCDLQTCEERDPKGLYKKARAGEIDQFTGVSAPYEEPESPEVILQTDKESIETATEKVLNYLMDAGIVPKTDADVLSEEEEETIRRRLKDLGYL